MALTDAELMSLSAPQLYDVIVEESAELIQATLKLKKFGHKAVGVYGKEYDNLSLMLAEYNQVMMAVSALRLKLLTSNQGQTS